MNPFALIPRRLCRPLAGVLLTVCAASADTPIKRLMLTGDADGGGHTISNVVIDGTVTGTNAVPETDPLSLHTDGGGTVTGSIAVVSGQLYMGGGSIESAATLYVGTIADVSSNAALNIAGHEASTTQLWASLNADLLDGRDWGMVTTQDMPGVDWGELQDVSWCAKSNMLDDSGAVEIDLATTPPIVEVTIDEASVLTLVNCPADKRAVLNIIKRGEFALTFGSEFMNLQPLPAVAETNVYSIIIAGEDDYFVTGQ